MAQKECTGTIAITSSILGNASISAFIWCETDDIQAYLDMESTIVLGNTFDLATAKKLENHQAYEVIAYLSTVFTISTTAVADLLVVIVSKLTAAQIGMGRSIGDELPEWTERLKNEAWASLQRAFITQTLPGSNITAKSVPFSERLLMGKARERTIIPNV